MLRQHELSLLHTRRLHVAFRHGILAASARGVFTVHAESHDYAACTCHV